MKSYLNEITVADLAKAMNCDAPGQAVEMLNETAFHRHHAADLKTPKVVYQMDIDVVTWHATSLAIRFGLLMEWLAAEVEA